MDDLCFKINIVLNECSRFLCEFEKDELYESSCYKMAFKVSRNIFHIFKNFETYKSIKVM